MAELSPERYLAASVREYIEQSYYAMVNEQARFENLIRNPHILEDAAKHPAFFSDHGSCMCATWRNKSCGCCKRLMES